MNAALYAKIYYLYVAGYVVLVALIWPRNNSKVVSAVKLVTISLLSTFALFWVWAIPFFWDDAGIILKYLDNFKNGEWFVYNEGGDRVYGISSFLHGLLAGIISRFTGLTAEQSLYSVNILGVFTALLATLYLICLKIRIPMMQWSAFLLLIVATKWSFINAFMGMETPLHIGILVGAISCLLYGRMSGFWFLSALAVISKMDAVPLVVLWGGIALLSAEKRFYFWPFSRDEYRTIAVYFLLPLAFYIVAAWYLFGSVFPHTAATKLAYAQSGEPRIMVIAPLLQGWGWVLVSVTTIVSALHVLIERNFRSLLDVTPFVGVVAYIALYIYFNPLERMPWYYALPEYLLLLQLVLILPSLITRITIFSRFPCWATIAAVMIVVLFGAREKRERLLNMAYNNDRVEGERIAIGRYIRDNTMSSEVIVAGHGYIAREADRFVVDYSGLNSPEVTGLGHDLQRILAEYMPTFVVVHNPLIDPEINQEYNVDRVFYDISWNYGRPWFVYRRIDGEYTVVQIRLEGQHPSYKYDTGLPWSARALRGNPIVLELPRHNSKTVDRIIAGVRRAHNKFDLNIYMLDEKKNKTRIYSGTIQKHSDDRGARYFYPLDIYVSNSELFADARYILFTSESNEIIELVEPVGIIMIH